MPRVRKSKVDTLVKQIASLSNEELAELRKRIPELLDKRPPKEAGHDIMELEGLGKEFWRSIDVDEYLKQERDSWGS